MKHQNQTSIKSIAFILLIMLSLLPFAKDACTEQWRIVDLGATSTWKTIGNVKSDNDNEFYFYRSESTSQTSEDIGGAAWSLVNLSNKKGIQISFTPVIGIDNNFYGNVKYPQGFAIVFTSSQMNDLLIGNKGSGLGYDGINTAVAFEFDFVQQTDKNDAKYPHFSIHYNLNGPVSSVSPLKSPVVNKQIDNFYDSSKDMYFKNVKIYIELYGGNVNVYTNTGTTILKTKFSEFESLLENENVVVGITAAMNLYKSVSIRDFTILEIAESDQGQLSSPSGTSFIAGNDIIVKYEVKSACGVSLKVFESQYNENIAVKINNQPHTVKKLNFDSSDMSIKIHIEKLTLVGSYSLIVQWKDKISNIVQLKINTGNIKRVDLCNPSTYNENYEITSTEELTDEYMRILVCSYDQYGNEKPYPVQSVESLISVNYPNNFAPNKGVSTIQLDNEYKKFLVTIPLISSGTYEIFNQYFKLNNKRYFNLKKKVSYSKTICEIQGHKKKFSDGEPVNLIFKIKDQFGDKITTRELNKLKCNLENSYVLDGNKEKQSIKLVDVQEEDYAQISITPDRNGEFTFYPMIKCEGDDFEYALPCEDCTIYYLSGTTNFNRLKVFSDFYLKDYYTDQLSEENPLILSMEEENNKKLFTAKIVNASGIEIEDNKISLEGSVEFSDQNIKIIGKISEFSYLDFFFESNLGRSALFNQFTTYKLTFNIKILEGKKEFVIFIKFLFIDDFMNNVIKGEIEGTKYLAFFKKPSFTFKASSRALLFDLYEVNDNIGAFTEGNNLNCEGVLVLFDGKPKNSCTCEKNGIYLSISDEASTAGTFNLSLSYNDNIVTSLVITILPGDTVEELVFDIEEPIVKSYDKAHKIITLNDIEMDDVITYKMTMIDKYKNTIVDNARDVFETITLIKKNIEANVHFGGVIIVVFNKHIPGEQSITFTLPNQEKYTIKATRKLGKIDPTTSIAEATYDDLNTIAVGGYFKVKINLKDSYSNILTPDNDVIYSLDVYALKTDNSRYVDLIGNIVGSTLEYKGKASVAGDYQIKVFYDNVSVKCYNSFFYAKPATFQESNTILYYIDYKQKIPIFKDKNTPQIINKQRDFAFFIETRDDQNNIVPPTKSFSNVRIVNADESTSSSNIINMCPNNQNKEETKYLYQICSGAGNTFKNAKNGIYKIKVNTMEFYIYLTDKETSSSTSLSSSASMLMLSEKTIIGRVDKPASFVVDIRNTDSLRFESIDLTKFTFTFSEPYLKANIFLGPSKGLVTVVISSSKSGKYKVQTSYSSKPIGSEITVVIHPGTVAKLKLISEEVKYFYKGNIVFFQATDSEGNFCGLGELSNSNFTQFLITAKDLNRNIMYSSAKEYNALKGVISISMENFITGLIKFDFAIGDNDDKSKTVVFENKISSANDLYAMLSKTKVNVGDEVIVNLYGIDSGNKIYSLYEENFAKIKGKIGVVLVRTENDIVSFISYNELTESNNFKITFPKGGDYLIIPHYNNKNINCGNCRVEITSSKEVDFSKTRVFTKEGPGTWLEKGPQMVGRFFLYTFPVFKINLFDKEGAQLFLNENDGYTFKLFKTSNDQLTIKTYFDNNGDIYVYLDEKGRDEYLKLKEFTSLNLQILGKTSSIIFSNYIILNSVDNQEDNAPCIKNAIPTIYNYQSSYTMRADKNIVLEFELKGCQSQRMTFYEKSDFSLDDREIYNFDIIPGDTYGTYLLFISSKKANEVEDNLQLKFKQSTVSEPIIINVISGYTIHTKEVYLYKEENEQINNVSPYAYFYVKVKDINGNEINPESSNLFYNDIYVDVYDGDTPVPYKITYNKEKKEYQGFVHIYGSGSFTVEGKKITIPSDSFYLYNTEFTLKEKENSLEAEFTIRDTHYVDIKDTEYSDFTFTYFTYNPITGERFSRDLKMNHIESKFQIEFPELYPKFQFYLVIPFHRIYATLCQGCFMINKNYDSIFSYINQDINPISLKNQIHIDIAFNYPLYMVHTGADSSIDMGKLKFTKEEISLSSKKIVLIGYKSNPSSESGSYDVKINDYSTKFIFHTESTASSGKASLSNFRHYGKISYNYISGDLVAFYVEFRDSNNKLTSDYLTLSTPSGYQYYILIPTSVKGVYYYILPTSTSVSEMEYVFTTSSEKSNDYIGLSGTASYPITFDVKDPTRQNWKEIRYTIDSKDQNGNRVCDQRLNFHIISTFEQNEFFDYEYSDNQCYLYVEFIGSGDLLSNIISNFVMKFINIEALIKDPFISYLAVTPNILFESGKLTLDFVINSHNAMTFPKDTVMSNLKLDVYKRDSETKKELVHSIEGLYSLNYVFDSNDLKIYQNGKYFLVASVDDCQLSNVVGLTYFHVVYQSPEKFNVVLIKSGKSNNVSNKVTQMGERNWDNAVDLKYSFEFMVQLMDKNGNLIKIPDGAKFESFISQDNANGDLISVFDFKSIKTDDFSFLITLEKNKINDYLHLPKDKYKYMIVFRYQPEDSISKFIQFVLTINYLDGILQYTDISKPYSKQGNEISQKFNVVTEKESEFIIGSKELFMRTVCLAEKDQSIYNDYLDINQISLNGLNSCSYSLSVKYRGCFDLYVKCEAPDEKIVVTVSYNSIEAENKLNVRANPNYAYLVVEDISQLEELTEGQEFDLKFRLTNEDHKEIKYIRQADFIVYLNEKKLSLSEYDIWYIDMINFKIYSKAISPTTSGKQELEVFFKYNNDIIDLSGLRVSIPYIQSTFRDMVLAFPQGFSAGEALKFRIILKDIVGNCYYKDKIETAFKAKVTINQEVREEFAFSVENIDNFERCKKVILVKPNFEIIKAGSLTFTVYDTIEGKTNNEKEITLVVVPGPLNSKTSSLQIVGQDKGKIGLMEAGEEAEIKLDGFDSYENKIDFYDLKDHFKIQFKNSLEEENPDYKVDINVNEENTGLRMFVTFNKMDTYTVVIYIKGAPFEPQDLKIIKVSAGACSFYEPSFTITPNQIDPGEMGTIIITCKDQFGNQISKQGNEAFSIDIKGKDLEIISEERILLIPKFNPNTLQYSASAIFAYQGKYSVQVYLNGRNYGELMEFELRPQMCGDGKIMCPDRTCVTSQNECNYDFDNSKCLGGNVNDGKIYYCNVDGEPKCARADECDCPQGFSECDGLCLPDEANYCIEERKTSCVSIAQLLYPSKKPKECTDGSCRLHSCPKSFTCPLGYLRCGAGCAKYNGNDDYCKVDLPKCKENQVRCWDLTCANSYELCPTRKSCGQHSQLMCPDGTCVFIENIVDGIPVPGPFCNQPPKCEKGVLCDDLTCKNSIADCTPNIACPIGLALCSDGQCREACGKGNSCELGYFTCPNGECVINTAFCSSEVTCPSGYIKCASGGCASSMSQCDYIQGPPAISCPISEPILCPDLSCVASASSCSSKVPSCPPNSPYLCWNNECRKKLDQCPTIITCPVEYPTLCNNGLCQKGTHHCKNTDDKTCGNDYVRCFDGSCVKSISLCPTYTTCPIGKIKCWNGACVEKISECPTPQTDDCPANTPYRCMDGTCRDKRESCSTISVCPSNRPVKCYDNSCRADLSACPEYQSCGHNMKSCPDGTCAATYEECNTIVTCYSQTPFLCYDNTCVADLRDCPTPPTCEGKVLCPTAICVTNRQNCKFFEACPMSNPVRCDDNTCVASAEECNKYKEDCPVGYIICPNGGCQIAGQYCESFVCPPSLPYKCPEGTCVIEKNMCDNDNGCPYNKIYKCPNGKCVIKEEECAENQNTKCNNNQVTCDDGSCANKNEECPQKNGCTSEKSQKCADGTCINPKTSSCPKVQCNLKSPIMCPDGTCVKTISDCTLTTKEIDHIACNLEGLGFNDAPAFMCADGRCVPSNAMCRPIFECHDDYWKCGDGSCRVTKELCPEASSCPKERPYFCSIGNCVKDESNCTLNSICPYNHAKCPTTGECIDSMKADCPSVGITKDGCADGKVKCDDGRCLSNVDLCNVVNIACTEETPYLCPNGICAINAKDCKSDTECKKGSIRCTDGRCVEEGKEEECLNSKGCPKSKPLRCEDGQCVSEYTQCNTVISCEKDKPYLCGDKTCVADTKFCTVLYPCEGNRIRCDNGFCVDALTDCDKYSKMCPITIPIKCPNGRCVSDYSQCSFEKCSDDMFYCYRLGRCVISSIECYGEKNSKGVPLTSRRNLQEKKGENSCDSDRPYSCYDGVCQEYKELCTIFPSCDIMKYRCEDGTCKKSKDECEKINFECAEGLTRCTDGLCRQICPEFNGCKIGELQCTNGMCVSDELECIGYSMCKDPNTPYRCFDGSCVSNPTSCNNIKRLSTVKTTHFSYDIRESIELPFVYDKSNTKIGYISIPGYALKSSSNKQNVNLLITEVAHSTLYEQKFYNSSSEFLYNVSNGIAGSDGVLNFENSVLSPIISINSTDVEKEFKFSIALHLEHNVYSASYDCFVPEDYCLAILNEDQWNCVDRSKTEDQEDFSIKKLGIYAVIINPLRKSKVFSIEKSRNFFFENIKVILIVAVVLVIVSAIVFYVFTRIIRYRKKYHANREKIALLRQQKEEYELMSTDVYGQTLGDNIMGLVYRNNCTYSENKEDRTYDNSLENDVEELNRKCNNVEKQNHRLQRNIDEVNDEAKALMLEIESLKN